MFTRPWFGDGKTAGYKVITNLKVLRFKLK